MTTSSLIQIQSVEPYIADKLTRTGAISTYKTGLAKRNGFMIYHYSQYH